MTMGRTAVRCPAILALYFMSIGIWDPILGQQVPEIKNITASGELGGDVLINCIVSPAEASIDWLYEGKNFVTDDRKTINLTVGEIDGAKTNRSTITIKKITYDEVGNYTCLSRLNEERSESVILRFNGKLINITQSPIHVNVSESPNITCIFEVFNATEMKWYKKNEADKFRTIPLVQRNGTHQYVGSHCPPIHYPEDNGTYVCEIEGTDFQSSIYGTVDILVYDKPNVSIDVIAINTTELYMNWTLQTFNSAIKSYSVMLRKNKTEFIHHSPIKVNQTGSKNTSFIIDSLNKSTMYDVKLEVKTMHGSGFSNIVTVTTLATLDEPVFIPNISINGFSATAVTIGWTAPSEQKKKYIHYYLLEARKKDEERTMNAYHPRDDRNLPYMFDNLKPHSTYVFKVRACADYGGSERCGNWSEEMEAATLDGLPSKPTNVVATCDRDFMELRWAPPANPNAEIKGYTMELRGQATYLDRYGLWKNSTWGPLSKFKTNSSTNVRFDDLQPYTNYTVQISAMTRTRRRGVEETANCTTLKAPPNQPPKPRWWKIQENDEFRFKMYLPRVSERNGPICCYRIYMVRLHPNSEDWNKLNSPNEVPIIDYKEVHAEPLGAYIADVITNKQFPEGSEIVLGDSKTLFNPTSDPTYSRSECWKCLKKPDRPKPTPPTTTTSSSTTPATTTVFDDGNTEDPVETTSASRQPDAPPSRRRRNTDDIYSHNKIMQDNNEDKRWKPVDGPLDSAANYTLFVELITGIDNELPLYSNFLNTLRPIATPTAPPPSVAIEIALQATCGIAALVLLLMIIFCIRQTRRSRKTPAHAQYELDAFRRAYKFLTGGRTQHVPTTPPNMPPIPRSELAAAYAERQADSDFGFQKEFEILPECFSDRTTHASDARENQPKNRYPDIKAYDQTRVKLSQIDSITGSDYINANYVNGYQERKRFICAQGPTDTTVNDFWRMIWEHGLELIVMLTNLEEYSKVKCSKYWPDEDRGARAFGNISVTHVAERRYSDYIVRELKVTKQPVTSDGQPIVENNGVAKRNGDCKEAGDGSAPTSPREMKEDARIVKQYHFLMWKDFAAPEHAYSILKFIKRVNEAWSRTVVRPCVVHCSAGVGRTGTLVALDCLLEQLHNEGHVAIFNTIAEMRRARSFLVQSPKQYIFVYRALVEYAHYGDTEIPACRLKTAIDRLRNTPPGGTACLMEAEFEKILNSPISEPVKSCAAGAAEELRSKNRSQDILPYDRNRVILAPIPTREFSTYINASFIEAYDNSESFIITQDPLPNTIMDFWRMVSEHNVSTIVMLSELGDGKCPRYWDDGTSTYDHISVQYEESESCPYYTRRQFRLHNNKCGTTQSVVALQYQGWPTAVGAVPEVTRGLAELADAAASDATTMLAHCQLGTERSALFVALCILIWQLRTERRVDVCSVARKVRSQRASTIDTFLHYEFLHRAILNYAELHNLLEDS